MAATYIGFDQTSAIGARIASGLRQLQSGREQIRQALAIMAELKDGDGSQAAHFDLLASKGGFTAGDYADANAAAKASYDELLSLYSKLSTDASVSAVSSAINQAFARHGV